MRRTAVLLSVMAASVLFAACGDRDKPDVLDELARVAAVERGRPVLVFVYTDG